MPPEQEKATSSGNPGMPYSTKTIQANKSSFKACGLSSLKQREVYYFKNSEQKYHHAQVEKTTS